MENSTPSFEHPFFIKIERRPGLNLNGKASLRRAARAVILKGDCLWMVYSQVNGDYKFPGGGIKDGEEQRQALMRELREETGATLNRIIRLVGITLEYDRTKFEGYEFFKMFSYYYLCTIGADLNLPQLDPYEAELGFTPVWVKCSDALQNNSNLFADETAYHPGWLRREMMVLKIIQDAIKLNNQNDSI